MPLFVASSVVDYGPSPGRVELDALPYHTPAPYIVQLHHCDVSHTTLTTCPHQAKNTMEISVALGGGDKGSSSARDKALTVIENLCFANRELPSEFYYPAFGN